MLADNTAQRLISLVNFINISVTSEKFVVCFVKNPNLAILV